MNRQRGFCSETDDREEQSVDCGEVVLPTFFYFFFYKKSCLNSAEDVHLWPCVVIGEETEALRRL